MYTIEIISLGTSIISNFLVYEQYQNNNTTYQTNQIYQYTVSWPFTNNHANYMYTEEIIKTYTLFSTILICNQYHHNNTTILAKCTVSISWPFRNTHTSYTAEIIKTDILFNTLLICHQYHNNNNTTSLTSTPGRFLHSGLEAWTFCLISYLQST